MQEIRPLVKKMELQTGWKKPNTHRLEGELKVEVTITKVMCYNFVLCNFC